MATDGLPEALAAFGLSPGELPRHPVLHRAAGTLLTFRLPGPDGSSAVEGAWVRPDGVRFYGPRGVSPGASLGHGLSGTSAELFDRWAEAVRRFLEAIEEVDSRLDELESKGSTIPTAEVWQLQRTTVGLRAQIGRAIVAAAECAGPLKASFPKFDDAYPSLLGELLRVQGLAANVQQALSDLILLQNARQSNRIAEIANDLSKSSNRIAQLANISNIRMLGITYIALLLGLVSAAVLIPNTAGTILGMPSAAWVPGYWVDAILVILGVLPIVVIFSRPWVVAMLRTLSASEARVTEGVEDLPERPLAGERPRR
ncbi:MAG TPA: hypothetical protein VMH90_00785 [Thermoplasmata archaeon]|nr:hypothetical protein [Thermoplasmata archaeon]